MKNRSFNSCWEFYDCKHTDCPAHGTSNAEVKCWLIASTYTNCPSKVPVVNGRKECWRCPYFIIKHIQSGEIHKPGKKQYS